MNEYAQNGGTCRLDIKELFSELFRWKYIVAGIIAAALLISFLYTELFCTPTYTAVAKVHVLDNQTAQSNSAEYSISTYLTRDYTILVSERVVLDSVIEKLDLNVSYQSLKSCISTVNPANSRIIEVYVTTENPELSANIANSVCSVSKDVMLDLTGSNRVNIVSQAEKPLVPSSPNMQTNLSYGLLAGILAAVIFVTVLYYKDDKINGSDDVQKYLGLCTLGTIPYNQNKNGKSNGKRKAVKG